MITTTVLAKKNEGSGGEQKTKDNENILLRPQSDRCMENIETTIRFEYLVPYQIAVFRIRIRIRFRIKSGQWIQIRIRIQEGKNGSQK